MSRDHRKLRVFFAADALALRVMEVTARFPAKERFGLQSQLRRAALSVPCNIVEGSARHSTSEYVHFLNIAAGSLAESRYLLDVSCRLGYVPQTIAASLDASATELAAELEALMQALRRLRRLERSVPEP